MTNTSLLRQIIREHGMTLQFVAAEIGLTYQGFLNKLNNIREFKASEMQALKDLLTLTDEEFQQVFFCRHVAGKATI